MKKNAIKIFVFMLFCMMQMLCITSCGEKETKEYPELVTEHVNLSKSGISYELDMPLIKKTDKNIYTNIGSRDVSEFLDGDVQIVSDDRVSWQLAGHKEYPDIGVELSLNENYVTNIEEQSKKEFQNSVYSLKEIGQYTGNNIEGYLYQFNESTGRFHNNNSYAAYLIKSVDNGYLCTIIVASNAKDSNLIDYILEKFKNEFGELKFEKV